MLYQFNNIITLNRGDSYDFSLDITDDFGQLYELRGNDALYFGIMDPQQPFEDALVKKKFVVNNAKNPSGEINGTNIVINIKPEDTLDLIPGKYYYAIKLHMNHIDENPDTGELTKVDRVCTIINKTKFIILE